MTTKEKIAHRLIPSEAYLMSPVLAYTKIYILVSQDPQGWSRG
jgi:hypothetical protein